MAVRIIWHFDYALCNFYCSADDYLRKTLDLQQDVSENKPNQPDLSAVTWVHFQ